MWMDRMSALAIGKDLKQLDGRSAVIALCSAACHSQVGNSLARHMIFVEVACQHCFKGDFKLPVRARIV
jgi:cytochrome c553